MKALVLASGSPRRVGLLRGLGLSFVQVKPEIDETPLAGEQAGDFVARLAKEKAARGMALAPAATGRAATKLVVVAADTVVALDGNILGKPGSKSEGIGMLAQLSGREHRVLTGLAVGSSARTDIKVVETRVRFRHVAREEMEQYWETGEPWDKAGAYGIQGMGAVFVESIQGSYTNVVGLPVAELHLGLASFGINCLAAAPPANDLRKVDEAVADSAGSLSWLRKSISMWLTGKPG